MWSFIGYVVLGARYAMIYAMTHASYMIGSDDWSVCVCVCVPDLDGNTSDSDKDSEEESEGKRKDGSWSSVFTHAFGNSRKKSKGGSSSAKSRKLPNEAPTMKKSPSLTNLSLKDFSFSGPASPRKKKRNAAMTLDSIPIKTSPRSASTTSSNNNNNSTGSSTSTSSSSSNNNNNNNNGTTRAPASVSSPSLAADLHGSASSNSLATVLVAGADEATLRLDIRAMANQPEFHDVQFVIGANRLVVYGHKVVLCARSAYLHSLIVNSPNSERFELLDMHERGFLPVLHYLYSGALEVTSSADYYHVLEVATRLRLDAVVRRCMAYVADNLMEPADTNAEPPEPDTSNNEALAKIADIEDDLQTMDETLKLLVTKLKSL
jgi:hypothetical protein